MDINTEYVDMADKNIYKLRLDSTTFSDGATCNSLGVVAIGSVEYFYADMFTLINTNDGSRYDIVEDAELRKVPYDPDKNRYKKRKIKKLSLNGSTYDVVATVNESGVSEDEFETDQLTYWVLYHNGEPAGRY